LIFNLNVSVLGVQEGNDVPNIFPIMSETPQMGALQELKRFSRT
jgi:hypothetical protein